MLQENYRNQLAYIRFKKLRGWKTLLARREITMFDKIMDRIADALASKQAFIIFIIIAIFPLAYGLPNSATAWQAYISQTLIQLVALNVLGYQNKKESKILSKIILEIHDTVMFELISIKKHLKDEKEERKLLGEILKELKER